jgi:antitoxin YefM
MSTKGENAMAKTMPIMEARKKLNRLSDELNKESEVVEITRHGKPVLAVMSWDGYESIVETLEIMGDSALMAELKNGILESKAGKTVGWEQVKKRLAT